jgi:exonuclease SbcC
LFITRVELKNIKNHAERVFTFQPGVIAIGGPNGSGKTTILEAIAWTLFDHLDYKREDFVRRGTKKGQATVGFVSDLDGREYLVTRDTAGGYFVYDPVTRVRLVEQKSQVLPWLRQRLGVEAGTDLAALFRTTLGVPQGAFTYDFTLPPSSRKAIFDQILRVEEYRQAADGLRIPQRLAENRVIEADRQLSRYEGELAGGDETQSLHDQVTVQWQAQAADLARALADRTRLEGEVEQLDRQCQAIDRQRQVVEQGRVRLDALGEGLQTAHQAVRQAEEAARVVDASRDGWQQHLDAGRHLAGLESQREERDRQRAVLARHEHRLVEAQSLDQRAGERLAEVALAREAAAPLTALSLRQEQLELQMARLLEGRGEALSLQSARRDLEQELERLRARYQALTAQIDAAGEGRAAAAEIIPLETERRNLEAASQRLALARQTIELKRHELDRLIFELPGRQAAQAQLQEELARLESFADRVDQIPGLEAREQELTAGLARQRAELARDREMITALETGGLCPLLTERCLNLRPGESPGLRFRDGLARRQAALEEGEQDQASLVARLVESRRLALDYARLAQLGQTLTTLTDAIGTLTFRRDELVAEIAALVATILPTDSPAGSDSATIEQEEWRLRQRLHEVDQRLSTARQAQLRLHQAEVLGEERARVQGEGEARRVEFDRIVARLAELGDVDSDLRLIQLELRQLNDPRGRLLALTPTLEREPEWQREAEVARQMLADARQAVDESRASLATFDQLDARMAATVENRFRTEPDYLAYIANEQLAGMLARRQEEVAALTAEIDRLELAHREAGDQLAGFESGYDPERHRLARLEYDRVREEVTQLSAGQLHLEEQLSSLAARLATLATLREEMEALARERAQLHRLGGRTEMIRDILIKAAPFITESYLFSISHEANQLYREITGRYDVTLRWTRDYEITLEEDGHDRPFLNLSGGEQMAAALAVRLALLRDLSEIDVAFFDEPTTNMDEERRRNLALQLGRISDFNQLFVISHDDSFEGLTDQQINLGQPS